ncbi:MAG: endo-1,4-beta-xylanase [Asticcacaulis sp.]|nr:endo-1,4-beta-xylanase [Asticcacaulis sp.]
MAPPSSVCRPGTHFEPPTSSARPGSHRHQRFGCAPIPALKDRFAGYFRIGMALDPRLFSGSVITGLVRKHASSLTPENVMKPSVIGLREGV